MLFVVNTCDERVFKQNDAKFYSFFGRLQVNNTIYTFLMTHHPLL